MTPDREKLALEALPIQIAKIRHRHQYDHDHGHGCDCASQQQLLNDRGLLLKFIEARALLAETAPSGEPNYEKACVMYGPLSHDMLLQIIAEREAGIGFAEQPVPSPVSNRVAEPVACAYCGEVTDPPCTEEMSRQCFRNRGRAVHRDCTFEEGLIHTPSASEDRAGARPQLLECPICDGCGRVPEPPSLGGSSACRRCNGTGRLDFVPASALSARDETIARLEAECEDKRRALTLLAQGEKDQRRRAAAAEARLARVEEVKDWVSGILEKEIKIPSAAVPSIVAIGRRLRAALEQEERAG